MHNRIAAALAFARLSQADLARRLGVTPNAVNAWVSGRNKPDTDNLEKIAIETGTSFEWLATGRGEMVYMPIHGVGQTVAKYDVVTRTDDQRLLLQLYSKLKPTQRQALLTLLKNW